MIVCSDFTETVIKDLKLPKLFTTKLNKDLEIILEKVDSSNLEFIVLFGSCARNTYKVGSDLDLLIVTNKELGRVTKGEVCSELDSSYGIVSSDAVFYTIDQLRNGTSLFIKSVIKEGIVIWKRK